MFYNDGIIGRETFNAIMNYVGDIDNSTKYNVGDFGTCGNDMFIYDGHEWQEISNTNDAPTQHITNKTTAFSCLHCGGNQIKFYKGKRICAFCESEIITQI